MNTRREDCFYFSEVTDYGGHIPFCGVTAKLEDCPCQECKNYIPKNGAYQVIRKYQNGEIVAVRHGYWTCVNTDENVYMCDGDGGCGCTIQLIEGTPKENMFDYCPECGARLIDEMEYKMLYHSAFPDGKESNE